MLARSLLVASSLLATLTIAAPPAAAATCAFPFILPQNGAALGTVGNPALGFAASEWYFHTGHGTDVYVLALGAGGSTTNPEVQDPVFGSAFARLRIWDNTCTLLLCSVNATDTAPATCSFGGPARIEVQYLSGHEHHIHYTLAVVN